MPAYLRTVIPVLLLLLPGCGTTPAPSPKTCAEATTPGSGSTNPRQAQVFKHLDPGGQVLLYMDIEGDAGRLAAQLDAVLAEVAKSDELKVDLSKVKATDLARLLGLDSVTALGLSSSRRGAAFHNRAFMLAPAPRRGLLQLFDGKPQPFAIPAWAPADADFVMEQNLRLKTLADLLLQVLEQTIGGTAWLKAQSVLHQPLGSSGLTPAQLIDTLDTRVYALLRIDESRPMPLKDSAAPVPYVELLLAADRLTPLFRWLVAQFGAHPRTRVRVDGPLETLELLLDKTDLPALYQPLLALDRQSGRVYFATDPALLQQCLTATPTGALQSSAEYRAATADLPATGHGLSFRSSRLMPKITRLLAKLTEGDAEAQSGMELLMMLLAPGDPAAAAVATSHADGLYFASNDSSSHKTTLLTLPYGNPAMIGILAAVAVPSFLKYIRKSKLAEAEARIGACAAAVRAGHTPPGRRGLPATLAVVCPQGIASPAQLSNDKAPLAYGPALAGYRALGWQITDKTEACFQYQREGGPAPTFICRAWTDLDTDGAPAIHTLTGRWDAGTKTWQLSPVTHTGDEY